jgi:hypothetical protein
MVLLALGAVVIAVVVLAMVIAALKAGLEGPPAAIVPPVPVQSPEPARDDPPLARSKRPPAEAGPGVAALWEEHCRIAYRADPARPGAPITRLELNAEDGERFPCAALRHLDQFPDLEELEILAAMDLADADLTPLKGLKRLRELTILFGKITDAGLANLDGLTELEEVKIIGCEQIKGPGLAHLEGAKRLRLLSVSGCRIGGADLAHVRQLAWVKELDIGGMEDDVLGDSSLVRLEGWTGLETLDLGFTNPIRGPGLVHLKGLRDLRTLSLRNSPVTDDAVDPLSTMNWIRDLDLSGTEITRAGLDRLRQALPTTRIDPPERGR